jgi:ABC-type cobalt transport system substrate-binding protein
MMTSPKANTDKAKTMVIDDMTLSAWFDDELDPAEAGSVQAAIDAQPPLQQRLARMLVNDRRLREHYSEMAASQPLPEGLRELLIDEQDSSRPWFLRFSDWTLRSLPRPALVTAAMALALVIGVQIGDQASTAPAGLGALSPIAQIDSDHPWFDLLDSTPSGETRSMAQGQAGQVMLSYRNGDGQWCRQFSVQSPRENQAVGAVACRAMGQWSLGLVQPQPLQSGGDGLYRAASGGNAAIDGYIMGSMVGDVLMPSAERDLIEGSWQR